MRDEALIYARALKRKASNCAFSKSESETSDYAHELAEIVAQGPVVLACEPSLEGVLSAIGLGYLAHARANSIRLEPAKCCQPRIGELVWSPPASNTDAMIDLAIRVWSGFKHSCGNVCSKRLVLAASSDDPLMPECIHRYIRLGFSVGHRLYQMITDPVVAELHDLARYVVGECEHTRQFVRFSRMLDGSYWAVIEPRANTIPITCSHFAARMGDERFCLLDPRHQLAALYDGRRFRECALIRLDHQTTKLLATRNDIADEELYIRAMWQCFYNMMELPGRDASQRGYDLRKSWIPQRFWEHLCELDPSLATGFSFIPARYESTQ